MKRPRGFPKAEWRRMRAAATIEFRPPAYPVDRQFHDAIERSRLCDERCLALLEELEGVSA